jgi:hypothetical protein
MTAYLLHGATLTLAWFVVVNVVCACIAAWIARRPLRTESPAFWFALRVAPAAAAVLFSLVLFVPSYSRYEPLDSLEGFDITLTACAAIALVFFAAAAARCVGAWRNAVRRVRCWMRSAQRLPIDAAVPAFVVDTPVPVMALAGVVRPRLLVSRTLIDAFTSEELNAAVAHEIGHRRAFDNLKRLVMCAAPDALAFTSVGRALERRWASAAEHAADRMSDDERPSARWALASALVKVARLTPTEPSASEPISTLLGGADIASRVQRLLDDAPVAARPGSWTWVVVAGLATAVAASPLYAPALRIVHVITEAVVHSLP